MACTPSVAESVCHLARLYTSFNAQNPSFEIEVSSQGRVIFVTSSDSSTVGDLFDVNDCPPFNERDPVHRATLYAIQ